MKLRKLVGTILTGALLMTSGITAFAAVPDDSIVIHKFTGEVDIAYSNEYLNTELGSSADKLVKNMFQPIWEDKLYLKQGGKYINLQNGKTLDNKELRKTIYFDVDKVKDLSQFESGFIFKNQIYDIDFIAEEGNALCKSIYMPQIKERVKKVANNGIVGDCVIIQPNGILIDSENGKEVKRSDYPSVMNYYYMDVYESENGSKIK